jgi:molybdopterin-guanine dinucleotide biosynthesis protein A
MTTAAILSGGENSRLPHVKGLVKIDGLTIIERTLKLLVRYFQPVMIGANAPELYFRFGAPMVGDVIDVRGPLTGILSCLINTETDYLFVAACDMPFIKEELVTFIAENADGRDAVVPVHESRPQPLLALYHRRLIPVIEGLLARDKRGVRDMLGAIDVKYVDAALADPEGRSFSVNLNTPEDLRKIAIDARVEV